MTKEGTTLTPLPEALSFLLDKASDYSSRLLNSASACKDIETCDIFDAVGRVLAEPVFSAINVPPFDNSAMDGVAFCYDDVAAKLDQVDQTDEGIDSPEHLTLPLSQRITAGDHPKPLSPNSAARIFTGAVIPPRADTVEMQENCVVTDQTITLKNVSKIKKGQHIRQAGQDIETNQEVFSAGHRLKPQDLGVLASVGQSKIKVYRPLKIAILSTGNELVDPGEALKPGQIYNSNRALLHGLMAGLGWQPIHLSTVADNLDSTQSALKEAAQCADCIITTGGVSMGDEDYVRRALEKEGRLEVWKLAIKPGKPLAFGDVDGTPFFGLPGNPAAVWVTFLLLVKRFLKILQGMEDVEPLSIQAKAQFEHLKPGTRCEFVRARLSSCASGESVVDLHPNQSSGVLSSASWSNGLAVIPIGKTVQKNDDIEFLPVSDLLFS